MNINCNKHHFEGAGVCYLRVLTMTVGKVKFALIFNSNITPKLMLMLLYVFFLLLLVGFVVVLFFLNSQWSAE